ncbi:MAG: hypothetical protein M1819_006463 [Sarea resinae]|nr:MAG: hypothetical protein M1819_006463 [Sarea resinae]
MLLAFGSNGAGQLGLGHRDDTSFPTPSTLASVEDAGPPTIIAAGGNHTLVLFPSGALFATGDNGNGRVGISPSDHCLTSFTRVQFQDLDGNVVNRFKLCSATWESSTFVTSDDIVYTCGSGSKGELGQGEGIIHSPGPRPLIGFPPAGTEIVDLAACMGHTVAVLTNGDVYGWGNGRKGQLGCPNVIVWTPRPIYGLQFKAMKVACGREFTFMVGKPEDGLYAILGADKWGVKSAAPTTVSGWKDIGASWGSIFMLSASGTLTSWGRDDHGQRAPKGLPKLHQIAVGSEHILALSHDGRLLAWGWGEHGNCGPGFSDAADLKLPWNLITISERNAIFIGAGCATSWIWAS